MPYLIGTDEAGYSPHLGPLVISAAVFWVADLDAGEDLYPRLKKVVCRKPSRSSSAPRLAIGDSKTLYSPAQGLAQLERGVLAALALVNRPPADWLDVWNMLDPGAIDRLPAMPWHVGYDLRLPLAADADELEKRLPKWRRELEVAGVRLVTLKSRALFPDEFNRTNELLGNKSETLSNTTLRLLADVLTVCGDEPVLVVCDKHGGRNAYGRLLQQQFPDPLIEVRRESLAESVYRWQRGACTVEARFRVGGEAFLPTALASMASKYLRELSMRAFNEFWCGRVQNLSPTAGYSKDAWRFRSQVEQVQSALGIDDGLMWRTR